MAIVSGVVQSFAVPNYSGRLYAKGNESTPLLSAIGGRAAVSDSVEFVTGQEYDAYKATAQPKISETASLTAPEPRHVTRKQSTNVTQIFQEAVAISYAKMSNMGTLSGINIAGQQANPQDEEDFQIDKAMGRVSQDIEYTFINGKYHKATSDSDANQTRGLDTAITTNVLAMEGKPIGYWDVIELVDKMVKSGASVDGLVLWLDNTTRLQLNASAVQDGLTIVTADRTVNGIALDKLVTPYGDFFMRNGIYLPAGTTFMLNLPAIRPIEQMTKNKGNFFLEPLAKTGAGDKWQIYGEMGLDHGPEWAHGKFTGASTTFERPKYNQKVWVVQDPGAKV